MTLPPPRADDAQETVLKPLHEKLAGLIGVEHVVCGIDELDTPGYAENPARRRTRRELLAAAFEDV